MKTSQILLLTAVALHLFACASRQQAIPDSKGVSMQSLEPNVRAIQRESQMPGLQIAVFENDKTRFEYADGIRAQGHAQKVTSEDQWHIGSCTKPMTAFLIGRLIDQGKIDWKTTIGEIAPKNYKLHPSVKKITVEQMLSHQSGLADVSEPEKGKLWATLFTDKFAPEVMREKLVKGILSMPTRFQPGSKTEYSNSGYIVLGWIIEQKQSASWENVTKKDLFQKLGMDSCGFGPAGAENQASPTQPWSHALEKDQLVAIPPGIGADNPSALGPAGTVHCRLRDWYKFAKLYLSKDALPAGFLTEPTYNKLLSHAGKGPGTYSTIGRVDREWAKGDAFVMAGSNTMNYALLAIAPKLNRVFMVTTNAGHDKAEAGATKILKLLIEAE